MKKNLFKMKTVKKKTYYFLFFYFLKILNKGKTSDDSKNKFDEAL